MSGPIRPEITAESKSFWAGCREGVLRISRCDGCDSFVHPPRPVCPSCRSRVLTPTSVSPEAFVDSFTISYQSFRADLEAPYALALVSLCEAPTVRLTLRVAGADIEGLAIGRRVHIGFEAIDDKFAVPVIERIEAPDNEAREYEDEHNEDRHTAADHRSPRPMTPPSFARYLGAKPESLAVISGVGCSAIGRSLYRSDLDLTCEAALAAIADAGVEPDQIDGLAAYPGEGIGPPGYAGPRTDDVAAALGLRLGWRRAGAEGAGQLQPIFDGVLAVAAGLCSHALIYRTSTESTVAARWRDGSLAMPGRSLAAGFLAWLLPFDSVSAAHWLAPYATAHMHRFGTTREHLGAIALNGRANAGRSPGAALRDPLTMDDYLAARSISTPLGLLDCDVPVDGSVAIVVSRADILADLEHAPVRFEAIGGGIGEVPSWDQWPDLTTMSSVGAAASMWARTDLRPGDVDVAQLYDGFTFLALTWLEALGFCAHGEGGPFVEGGARIALDGDLPINTAGGQLSFGRLHGWGLLHEACLQLRGEADERQIVGAEVAVVSSGGGPIAGCALLTT